MSGRPIKRTLRHSVPGGSCRDRRSAGWPTATTVWRQVLLPRVVGSNRRGLWHKRTTTAASVGYRASRHDR